MKKKKTKILLYFCLSIIFLLIFHTTEFFRNSFFILRDNYEVRFHKNYEFCNESGLGFLNFIKNNFKVDENVQIKNFKIAPDSSWFFYKGNIKLKKSDQLILLNYQNENVLNFNKFGETSFVSANIPKNIQKLEKIKFVEKFDVTKIKKIQIINKISDYEKILFNYKLENNNYSINEILLNLEVHGINIPAGDLIIKFHLSENISMKNVLQLKITYKNLFNLNNFEIISKKENCYFLRKS